MNNQKHVSVLINESIESLHIKPNGIYVDATMGRGGHTKRILEQLESDGRIIGIDQDADAIKYCQDFFKNDKRVIIVEDNFVNLKNVLQNLKISFVDGILMDLGVSSPQLDNSDRGFSYILDGPLDMRMNQDQSLNADVIINEYSYEQLFQIFKKYGEVKNPSKVIRSIIKHRILKPIKTTNELVNIIKGSLNSKELFSKNRHPEKVYFQALRIATNNEIENLKSTIRIAAELLNLDGVLSIISFHSLEDKVVLEEFKKLSENKLPKEIPLNEVWCDFEVLQPKGVIPTAKEVEENKRSQSAKLRSLKRIKI